MSHATEKAIKDYFKQANPKRILEGLDTYEYLNHEEFGREILLLDAELGDILRNSEFNFEPQELADIVKRDVPTPLKNLVSSELDADRMDYLMRSSQATGLPYGNFDREYLIKNLTVGTDGQVCLNTKALRAADHFLISRSFDYLQTVFHKVVVGMEQMLQECVRALINADPSKYEANAMREAITNGVFLGWDDSFLLNRLRELSKQKSREGTMAARIVRRKPPTLIYSFESSAATDATPLATHREFFEYLRNNEPELCEELLFWEKEFGFMDVSPSRTIAKKENQVPEEEEDKLIRIKTGNGASEPLYRNQLSLMKVLGDQRYSFARCYFVGELDSLPRVNEKFARLANMAGRSDSLRR
jgi:HD superfamily phosphohydrolase